MTTTTRPVAHRRPVASRTLTATMPSGLHARYRNRETPTTPNGLTARQAGELERIGARLGRTTWRLRADNTVLLAVHGDQPAEDEQPLYLVLAADGTVIRVGGQPRQSHLAADED